MIEESEKESRLEAFERMKIAIEEEYASIMGKMDKMKAEGKVNSATYRQLMGRKMNYKNMLDMYRLYDL